MTLIVFQCWARLLMLMILIDHLSFIAINDATTRSFLAQLGGCLFLLKRCAFLIVPTKNVERWNKKLFWVLIMWNRILLSWIKRVFLRDKNTFCDNMTNFHPRLSGSLTNPSLQRKMICHDWGSSGKVNPNFYFCCSEKFLVFSKARYFTFQIFYARLWGWPGGLRDKHDLIKSATFSSENSSNSRFVPF